MRRISALAAAGMVAALAVTATAAAKGPSSASLTGPGLDHPLPVKGQGEAGVGTPLGSLVQLGGFFPEAYDTSPDPTTRARPRAHLGPRYSVAYRMPSASGASTIVQDVYPYAQPKPVTYMRPGQRFWGSFRTHGGWFVASRGLKAALVAAGLPKTQPRPVGSVWGWIGAGSAAFVVLLVLVLRRRDIARPRTLGTTT